MTDGQIFEVLRNTVQTISESPYGRVFVVKGGAALICKMIESGNERLIRKTTDIDLHCNSKEVWSRFLKDASVILNSSRNGYTYTVEKVRSIEKGKLGLSDSIKIRVNTQVGECSIKIDMNLKSNRIITVEYSPILNMNTYDRYTMLADKIVAISSKSIYRRIKDVYDIYALSIMGCYRSYDIIEHIDVKHGGKVLENMLTYENYEAISHAYKAFSGIVNKPGINEVLGIVSSFVSPIYESETQLEWNNQIGAWVDL